MVEFYFFQATSFFFFFFLFSLHQRANGLLQDKISRLNQENGLLKQSLTSTSAALKEARTSIFRKSNNNAIKV